jgi:hypothetical protein
MSSIAPESRILPDADNRLGRELIGSWVATAPAGYVVTVKPPRRTLDQNAIFHALVDDITKAKPEWNGMAMSTEDWKQLLILSHAVTTEGAGIRLVRDLEGNGLVQLRESSARMSKARATSLIDYTIAWASAQGIKLRDQ